MGWVDPAEPELAPLEVVPDPAEPDLAPPAMDPDPAGADVAPPAGAVVVSKSAGDVVSSPKAVVSAPGDDVVSTPAGDDSASGAAVVSNPAGDVVVPIGIPAKKPGVLGLSEGLGFIAEGFAEGFIEDGP